MKVKAVMANLLLMSVSISLVVGMAEVASRYTVPISPGPKLLSLDGEPLRQSYVAANSEYRIITPDFDAKTTITKDGYRAPQANGNPDTLFLGDSFTFAQGVKDDEAFAYLYCKEKGLECANLAVPGASTLYTLDRLEYFLKDKGWAPNNVFLFFFTGNDFSDNVWAAEQHGKGRNYEPLELSPDLESAQKGALPLHKRVFDLTLHYSNLMRVLYFKVLPEMRNARDPKAQSLQMAKALEITQRSFQRLQTLSEQYAFNYRVFVLFSEPEIRQQTYPEIEKSLQAIAPDGIISLGTLFAEDTSHAFFPSDGHLTVSGNRLVADFLVKNMP